MTSKSTIKESRTIISSSSRSGGSSGRLDLADGGGESDFYYKSNIHPRSTSVHRASASLGGMSSGGLSGGSSYKRTVEISTGHVPGYATVSSDRVSDVKHTREREKQDLRDLNERFANYIEKVRFLEAQNRKLVSELEELKSKWGKETSAVKTMYETELKEARDVLEETNKEKNKLEVRLQTLQDQMNDFLRQLDDAKKWRAQDRETINKLNQQVSDLEAEIRMLRRTNDSLDTERQRDKQTINRLNEELEKLRLDLSNETIQRLDAENRAQTLAEELEFLKSVHEQELKELAALAYRDTTAENREFWKNELAQAIRDIQNEYDSKMDTIRGEMETFYNLKVQEFRTGATKQNMEVTHAREETKKVQKLLNDYKIRMADLEARNAQLEKQYQDVMREMDQKEQEHALEINQLKDEMNKLRAEMESMLVELQTLMDAKLSLELEIAAYRKLLETEESRTGLSTTSQLHSLITMEEQHLHAQHHYQQQKGVHSSLSTTATATLQPSSHEQSVIKTSSQESQSVMNGVRGRTKKEDRTQLIRSQVHQVMADALFPQQSELADDNVSETVEDLTDHKVMLSKKAEDSQLSMKMMRGEVSAKTTYQRTANGPVAIAETHPEGKFVSLENNPSSGLRKDISLMNWSVVRLLDNKTKLVYKFPPNAVIKLGKTLKIWASNYSSERGTGDLIFGDENTWGVGSHITTTLYNEKGEEKACLVQKTLYS